MSTSRFSILLSLVAACGFPRPADVPSDSKDAAMDPVDAPGPPVDAAGTLTDAAGTLPRCDPTKPFGTPKLVENINSSNDEVTFALTRDERTALLGRYLPQSAAAIFASQRASASGTFGVPDGAVTSAIDTAVGNEFAPSLVSDGLILYFHRQTSNDIGIYAATRADASATFDVGTLVFVDGTGLTNALAPQISADGQTLYWADFIDFGKVFSATRSNDPRTFINKHAVSTFATGAAFVLSADELTAFYSLGSGADVLVSTRTSKSDIFGTGIPVANVNSAANDIPVALTYDGCVLYITSQRSGGVGGYDIWEAHRPL